ncbi:transcription elongation factor GreA [Agromyces sp. CCNWLW203]|uniref:transcription elongation factor GreA n=1 Tax=Agromyces sp. CCNWLW203 TaxID=3112842 RepID=UPI002F9640A5
MAQDVTATWLTQEAYDRLAAELEQLSTHGREDIAKRIESAREEGDLKENGGYHAAKDEQGKMEARIRQLKELLRTAEVGDAPQSSGVVEAGTVITAMIAGDEETFLIGSREIAGDSELDVWSTQSPLGAAILGLKVGEKTSYTAPNGREIAVEITSVETWGGQ